MEPCTPVALTEATRTRFGEAPRYAEGLYRVGEGVYAWMVPNGSWGEANAELIVAGHGPFTDNTGVQQLRNYWEYVVPEIWRRYDSGMPARQAARELVLSRDSAEQPFAEWDSPERIMVSAHTLYRNWRGQTRSRSTLKLVSIMWQQALLAQELPGARPAVMRRFPSKA